MCETQQESLCNLDLAIDKILRKVHVLKKRVIEIRSQYGSASGPGGSGDLDCKQTRNVEIKYLRGSKECREFCFEKIVGATNAKQDIQNGFVRPILYPNMYGKVSKGILLYGLPGTGKTLLAKATVSELQQQSKGRLKVVMLTPKGSDLKGKYFGETEQKIADLFECAAKIACERESAEFDKDDESNTRKGGARVLAVIFIDEIDAIGADREGDSSGIQSSSVNALLQAMDGVKSYPNVAVMAATNYPWKLDPAVVRRFESQVLVDLPTQADIAKLLNVKLTDLVTKVVKSKDKLCKESEDDKNLGSTEGCDADDYKACANTSSRYEWETWKDLGYFRELTSGFIEDMAKAMEGKHFSGSDLDRYFQQVRRASAARAMTNGFFIAGPILPVFENFPPRDRRAIISTLGLTTIPWDSLNPIREDLVKKAENAAKKDEKAKKTDNPPNTQGLGQLIMAPNVSVGRSFTTIELKGRLFRNIFDTPVTDFEYIPYQTDKNIRGTLVEVKLDESGEYHQNPDKTGKVLFHIAAPVQQAQVPEKDELGEVKKDEKGEVIYRKDDDLQGLDKKVVLADKNDQYQLLEIIAKKSKISNAEAQKKLQNLYAVGKQDNMHALVEVSIEDLQNVTTAPPDDWRYGGWFRAGGWLSSEEREKSVATETEKLGKQVRQMTSLLDNIILTGKFDYYVLVGNDVYHATEIQGQLPDFSEELRNTTTVDKGLIYTTETHPLYFAWLGLISYENITNQVSLEHDTGEIPDSMIKNDIRYVNWSIGDSDLMNGLTKAKATWIEENHTIMIKYQDHPEQVIADWKKKQK